MWRNWPWLLCYVTVSFTWLLNILLFSFPLSNSKHVHGLCHWIWIFFPSLSYFGLDRTKHLIKKIKNKRKEIGIGSSRISIMNTRKAPTLNYAACRLAAKQTQNNLRWPMTLCYFCNDSLMCQRNRKTIIFGTRFVRKANRVWSPPLHKSIALLIWFTLSKTPLVWLRSAFMNGEYRVLLK